MSRRFPTLNSRPARARRSALVVVGLAVAACSGSGSDAGPTPTSSPTVATSTTTATSATTGRSTTTATEAPGPSNRPASPDPTSVAGISQLLAASAPLQRFSIGDDRLGVWICHVGLDITDPIYNATDFRLDLEPEHVAELLNAHITPYYEDLSHGLYHPRFVAGGDVEISGAQTNRECVSEAQAEAPDDIDGLIVVADAEHGSAQPGGWGRPGDPCPADQPCPARVSGRATYIGSSDFHPDWGDVPAVDLEEHEIGHSIGLPHSGNTEGHDSALDLMSNSAAPRDVEPDRRDAPDTLAVNRLAVGWLPIDAVVVGREGDEITLVPSNAESGQRLLVLPLDGLAFITVEVLTNTGYGDHLPKSGIAIHRIDQSAAACRSGGNTTLCLNELRRQEPLHGPAPYTDLLQAGATWSGEGWTLQVVSAHDGSWTVQITAGKSTQ